MVHSFPSLSTTIISGGIVLSQFQFVHKTLMRSNKTRSLPLSLAFIGTLFVYFKPIFSFFILYILLFCCLFLILRDREMSLFGLANYISLNYRLEMISRNVHANLSPDSTMPSLYFKSIKLCKQKLSGF